ncbi:MAG TPA: hypothetical protein VM096_03380 [Vicinamibacterales bacterium]|nr:hypothetical protein [Vicinamibacterales bacterium]
MTDHLDCAIDRVAAEMTRVQNNDALASQIISALPDRTVRPGWMFQSWMVRVAMIAMIVTAGLVWSARRASEVPRVDVLASTQLVTTPSELIAIALEAQPNRTMPREPVEPMEAVEPSETDFDRSLSSIGAVPSLTLDSLTPALLPQSERLVLESLVIGDMPLTAEAISPRN